MDYLTAGALWARYGLDAEGWRDGVLLRWRDGIVVACSPAPRPPADVDPAWRFESHLLTPGLLNAHCHLDYSLLRGRLSGAAGFAAWLRQILAARRGLDDSAAEPARAAAAAALDELIHDGVTEIWDVASFGWAIPLLRARNVPAIIFREWIAPDPARAAAFDAWANATFTESDPAPTDGISPHAPYSVCAEGLRRADAWARRHARPVAIHLAESPEERELLLAGTGALWKLLSEIAGRDVAHTLGRGNSPIARAEEAGLIRPDTLAIHANLPEPGEPERLARAGCRVVFCPRSHAFFGYPRYPLKTWRAAGVGLALGTDSLASNDRLSIRAEARSLVAAHGWLRPADALACATGAWLGAAPPFGGRGRFTPGAPAHWALWKIAPPPASLPADRCADDLASQWLHGSAPLAASSLLPPIH